MSSSLYTCEKWNLYHLTCKVVPFLLTFVFGIYYFYHTGGCYPASSSTPTLDSHAWSEGMEAVTAMTLPRYEVCPDGGTLCPIDNVCCGHLCLSGGTIDDTTDPNTTTNRTNATCCTDPMDSADRTGMIVPLLTSTTGCGVNYMCSTTNRSMCTAIHPIEQDIPSHIPRTRLCQFSDAMTHVYAIPMTSTSTNRQVREEEDDGGSSSSSCNDCWALATSAK